MTKKRKLIRKNPSAQYPSTIDKVKQGVVNFVKSPVNGIIDTALYLADRAGAPTNATNYIRDLNVSIPYRTRSAVEAAIQTLYNGKDFDANYQNKLEHPSSINNALTITPLPNDNGNYSDEELNVIREMVNEDGSIDNNSIRKVSSDKRYGAFGGLSKQFTPDKVVQMSIGQARANPENPEWIHDVYDFNTKTSYDNRVNRLYMEQAKKNLGANYETLRAISPYINSTDKMPNAHKIETYINLDK